MYIYKRSEPRLWTVGYYDPEGFFTPESDHDSTQEAADRVHYMNGGVELQKLMDEIETLRQRNRKLQSELNAYIELEDEAAAYQLL